MKIVNLEAFRKLPAGTLFSKYDPSTCNFGYLIFKGETIEYDFFVSSAVESAIEYSGSAEFGGLLDHAEETGESFKMDFETWERDGDFDENQLFAVWESADVLMLIEKLKLCPA